MTGDPDPSGAFMHSLIVYHFVVSFCHFAGEDIDVHAHAIRDVNYHDYRLLIREYECIHNVHNV